MILNYLKLAFRSLFKQKMASVINLLGLSVGISACLIVLLYINEETSYDKFLENSERIYRLEGKTLNGNNERHWTSTTAQIKGLVGESLPEIEAVTRILDEDEVVIRTKDHMFKEKFFFYADDNFFTVLNYPLKEGDAATALVNPYSIVITAEMAEKYFGNAPAKGEVLDCNGTPYTVTGVFAAGSGKSHFNVKFLASMSSIHEDAKYLFEDWINVFYTYALVTKGADISALEKKSESLIGAARELPPGLVKSVYFHQLSDIHLDGNAEREFANNTDRIYIKILGFIALFILVLACINYVNLATSRSAIRSKEVGIRKTIGALKSNLITQFMVESLVTTGITVLLAVGLTFLILPFFNDALGKSLSLGAFSPVLLIAILLGLWIGIGLLAGLYPAFFLASFDPAKVLMGSGKGAGGSGRSGRFRKALVVFQFAIAVVLILLTKTVFNQMNYLSSTDLGFEKENVIVVKTPFAASSNIPTFKAQLLLNSSITNVAASSEVPGKRVRFLNVWWDELEAPIALRTTMVDVDYLSAMNIAVVKGRGFDASFPTDSASAFMLNEQAVKNIGWEDPIGKDFEFLYNGSTKEGKIIGVFKDYHQNSMHSSVEPLIMHIAPKWFGYVSIRYNANNIDEVKTHVQKTWLSMYPELPFDYFFLDDSYEELYAEETKLQWLFVVFSILAIFIACLGLLGLTMFSIEQRTKEIGVRKVLGASAGNLVVLLSRDFIKLVVIAFLIGAPLAWFLMDWWLAGFAYHASINYLDFLLALLLIAGLAFVTLSAIVLKATANDPVKALRYE